MRVYDKDKKLVKVICNRCGHQAQTEEDVLKEDFLAVEKQWGYFSEKDGYIHHFDLCEKCYDALLRSFVYPADLQDETEFV